MKISIPAVIAALTIGTVPAWGIAADTGSETAAVDPAAVQILQKMTSFVRDLGAFSVHTQTTLEDLLDSGQRIDFDVAADVTVRRPDKIRAQRVGGQLTQEFYYDGKSLTLFNPDQGVYATQLAPGTIEEMLDVAREELGLTIPMADLVYGNAYAILMQGVESATVFGKVTIDGIACDHLAFRRPDVDFQLWVASGDQPLPCKFAVTDTSTPALLSTVTVTSHWNLAPDAGNAEFEFTPPDGATSVTFLPAEDGSGGQ